MVPAWISLDELVIVGLSPKSECQCRRTAQDWGTPSRQTSADLLLRSPRCTSTVRFSHRAQLAIASADDRRNERPDVHEKAGANPTDPAKVVASAAGETRRAGQGCHGRCTTEFISTLDADPSLLQWTDEQIPEQFSRSLRSQLLPIPTTSRLHTECLEIEGLVVILHRHTFVHASVLGIIVHRVRDAIPAHEPVQ